MPSAKDNVSQSEAEILARILGNGEGPLHPRIARHILSLGFSSADKTRMHELAVRNQEDSLSPTERSDLAAFSKVGTILSILKSKARRSLHIRPRKRTIA